MGIAHRVNNHHWNYLLALDSDTAQISRYVEFIPGNFKTYSLELARLLMAASAEVDVVAKIACARVAPKSKPQVITDYYDVLSKVRPNLRTHPVEIKRYGLRFTPWVDWTKKASPLWWRACNAVKHRREPTFTKQISSTH